MRWTIRRPVAVGILTVAVAIFAGGPLFDWWRTTKQANVLRPIVEKHRAVGIDLTMTRTSGRYLVFHGFGLTKDQKEQLRRDVEGAVHDREQVDRIMKNVWTHSEVDAMSR